MLRNRVPTRCSRDGPGAGSSNWPRRWIAELGVTLETAPAGYTPSVRWDTYLAAGGRFRAFLASLKRENIGTTYNTIQASTVHRIAVRWRTDLLARSVTLYGIQEGAVVRRQSHVARPRTRRTGAVISCPIPSNTGENGMAQRRTNGMNEDMVQLAMAAPVVVAQRMMRMALAGASPTASDRREMKRMSAEKVEAFTESWNTTARRLTQAQMNFGFDLMRVAWSPWHQAGGRANAAATRFGDATTASVQGALGPVRRRAVANARRLGRKGLG